MEASFVNTISHLKDSGDDEDTVIATDLYDEGKWKYVIEGLFGPREAWTYVLKQYPRYVSMIYKYLDKVCVE